MFDSCQHMCNLENSCRIQVVFHLETEGSGTAVQGCERWNMRSQADAED